MTEDELQRLLDDPASLTAREHALLGEIRGLRKALALRARLCELYAEALVEEDVDIAHIQAQVIEEAMRENKEKA